MLLEGKIKFLMFDRMFIQPIIMLLNFMNLFLERACNISNEFNREAERPALPSNMQE